MRKFGPQGPDAPSGAIMHFHSTNLDAGCGRIFDTDNGAYFEYTLGSESGELEVYGVHLSNDIALQFNWLSADILFRTLGVKKQVWRKKAKGTLEQRAECILDLAAVYGWHVIDDEPHTYSKAELTRRWFHCVLQEGPVTTARPEDYPLLCSELLIALHSIDANRYWALMSATFPVIPTDALKDFGSTWWQLHGKAAAGKIVSAIEQVCPPQFEFGVRYARFGFWKRDRLEHGPNTQRSGSAGQSEG